MPRIERVKLYTDGACRSNPGQGAIGILILDENNQALDTYSECVGQTTNNRAEYLALIKGLECAAKHTRNIVHCFLDSELVVKQVTGVYRIRKEELVALCLKVKERESLFNRVIYQHVRSSNSKVRHVDRLAKQILRGD